MKLHAKPQIKKIKTNEQNKKPEQRLICPFGESLLAYKINGA